MKIFFTWSIRGGRENQPQFAYIVEVLKQYGEVLSEHIGSTNLPQFGETALTGKQIRHRELERLAQSDIVVAEVTTPSLWVGYLLGHATSLGKKVIALYHDESMLKLSAIIKGDELIAPYTYQNKEDVEKLFEEILKTS